MIENALMLLLHILGALGEILSVALLLGAWVVGLIMMDTESNLLFKEIGDRRYANKLFKKIEEYRNDFA